MHTKGTKSKALIAVVSLLIAVPLLQGWGFWAHKRINYMAVFTLPPEMFGFYKKHITHLSEHAVDADVRRYVTADEASRHYIDLDNYGTFPFDSLPRKWND